MGNSNSKVPRSKLASRWERLKTDRASWWSHWMEINSYLLPRSGQFYKQTRNNKNKSRYNKINDSTGTRALRILAAGMMSGLTSPARPWFRLGTMDPILSEDHDVKEWLSDITNIMLSVFQGSNIYRSLHSAYEELGAYGTAAIILLPDFKSVIHAYPLTAGEYAIATNWKGEVTTLFREFQKTVSEVVTEFGIENVSEATHSLFDSGSLDVPVNIIHAIEPRTDRDASKLDNKNMPFRSVYFEQGCQPNKYLRESGFNRFPGMVPRWSTSAGSVYGDAPGMESLGDNKQLQHEQLRKAQGIDYQTNPPLQVPISMKGRGVDRLPGGVSYVDQVSQNSGVRTAFDVNLRLDFLLNDIQDVRNRINSTFYADLFLMLANQTDARMTATEVAERHEEKLLMLGPVLERLQNELLDPLIEITFDQIMASGMAPPAPEALMNSPIKVELISMLAQAQRAIGTNSIDRFVGNLGQVSQLKPETLDKFDADTWVDVYSDSLGLDPGIVVPDDRVEKIRQQRAQQQAQQQQQDQQQQQADIAQKLSATKTDGQNALTDATRAFSGYS